MNLYEQQLYIEKMLNKNQLISRIKSEFEDCKDFNFAEYMTKHNIPHKFGFSLLVQMVLHKRANMETLVGCLRHHFPTAQEVVDMISKAADCNLIKWFPTLHQFVTVFTLSQQVQDELDRYQFPLPMIIPPKHISNNKQTGYLIGSGSVILRNNHTDDDVCLDHINRINKIALSINHDTATMIKNSWRNLDKIKPGETKADFERRKKAFHKYDTVAKDVIELMIQAGNRFRMTHGYDKRGRSYCRGYHINYQGNPWNKAVIEFADKEIIQ